MECCLIKVLRGRLGQDGIFAGMDKNRSKTGQKLMEMERKPAGTGGDGCRFL